jgi:hypothetical protein
VTPILVLRGLLQNRPLKILQLASKDLLMIENLDRPPKISLLIAQKEEGKKVFFFVVPGGVSRGGTRYHLRKRVNTAKTLKSYSN